MKTILALALAMLLGSSCKHRNSSTDVKGHYEEFTYEQMRDSIGKQTVIAEHDPRNNAVVLSIEALTRHNKEDLVKSIFSAGAEKVYLTVPNGYSQSLATGKDFANLRSAIGNHIQKVKLIEQQDQGKLSVWARDWAPIGALDQSKNPVLLDMNYYPNRVADDSTARSMGKIEQLNRVSLPIYNEGGNFMSNSRDECLMTDRVLEANSYQHRPDDYILDEFGVRVGYHDLAGCKSIHIFPRMPHEGTGHIDMWAKFLSDDTIIINELDVETIQFLPEGSNDRIAAEDIRKYLVERRAELEGLGYTVVGIPMPTPIMSKGNVRSYTNSLLVQKKVMVPRYLERHQRNGPNVPYPDEEAIAKYEVKVQEVYKKLGYEVDWIEADDLIALAGAIHCITMQLPL